MPAEGETPRHGGAAYGQHPGGGMSPVMRSLAWMVGMLLSPGLSLARADESPVDDVTQAQFAVYATAYNNLGMSYEMLGQPERAKEAYRQCLQINPRHPHAYVNLALLSERQGKFDDALAYWQRRAELGDPKDPWTQEAQKRAAELTRHRLVASRSRTSLPTSPAPPLSKSHPELQTEAERLTGELAKAYCNLGVPYTELRVYPKAIDAYEKSLALNPALPQAHAHLGLLYKQVRNDPDKASQHLQTYLRLNPHAADREELEALLALMQRDRPRSATGSSAATWGMP